MDLVHHYVCDVFEAITAGEHSEQHPVGAEQEAAVSTAPTPQLSDLIAVDMATSRKFAVVATGSSIGVLSCALLDIGEERMVRLQLLCNQVSPCLQLCNRLRGN